MGANESKQQITSPAPPRSPAPSADEPKSSLASAAAPESTHIDDLIKSGRYKVARPETLEMVRKIQPTPQQDPAAAGADIKDMRQYIIEQEGLDIGKARKRALSQQWRFFLSSEPIQRGMDAGLILGCVTAALSARNPAKRQAPRVAAFWLAGFSVGMIAVPTMVYVADSANSRQIKKKEKELFSRQREDFYNKSKE